MRSLRNAMLVSGLVLAVVVTTVLTTEVAGTRGMFASPTSVAVVNVPAVLEKLEQRAVAEAELMMMAQQIHDENEQWREKIEGIETQLKELPQTDETRRRTLQDQFARQRLEYEEWRRYKYDRLDIEKSLLMQDLYRKVLEALGELAEIEGYDIVLADDSGDALQLSPDAPMSREGQVRQQIRARRVLYANPAVDITDQLVERMNNAFSAGS